MEDLTVRELLPADAEAVIAHTKLVGGESDNLTFGAEGFPVSAEGERRFLAAMHDDPKSVMLGVFRAGALIATGSLNSLPRRMAHRAELGITVLKREWNRGVGSLLMASLIEYAKSAGIEIINLEVRSDNAGAIHLYEKFGFRRIGVSPAFFKIGDEYYDFVLMYLDLRRAVRAYSRGFGFVPSREMKVELLPGQEEELCSKETIKEIFAKDEKGECTAFDIYEGDELVGFIMFCEYPEGSWFLWNYAIDARFQNRGIGTRALSAALEYMKAHYPVKEFTTTYCWGNDHAKHVYEKVGFTETDVVEEEDYKEVNMVLKVTEEGIKVPRKEIEINGCVEVPPELSIDEFTSAFIQFVEANGWYFGGGLREIVDGFYINADGTRGKRVLEEE